jgi:hypothetical protein
MRDAPFEVRAGHRLGGGERIHAADAVHDELGLQLLRRDAWGNHAAVKDVQC